MRPSFKVEHSLSEIGSELLLDLLSRKDSWVSGLGAATAQQALQMFHLDYEIIYVSGWQVAAGSNIGVNTYPDLSLYPSNSTPNFVKKINNTLLRRMAELDKKKLPPIIADGESGFGGIYNVYELTNQFIDSGVSGIHFEDQLASEKKCIDDILNDFELVQKALKESSELRQVIKSPLVNSDEKLNILLKLFSKANLHNLTTTFLKVLDFLQMHYKHLLFDYFQFC